MKNAELDNYFETMANEKAVGLLYDDDVYAMQATPLKTPEVVKEEHFNKLVTFYKCNELRDDLHKAEELVKGDLTSTTKTVWEVDHALDTFLARAKDPYYSKHNTLSFQDLCGISNDTLITMFNQSQGYIENGRFQEAKALLTYLTVMAPRISSFWISLGVCFENLQDNSEAIIAYQVAKSIAPQDPQPCLCSVVCYLKMKEIDLAKMEFIKAESLVNSSDEAKQEWNQVVASIKTHLTKG